MFSSILDVVPMRNTEIAGKVVRVLRGEAAEQGSPPNMRPAQATSQRDRPNRSVGRVGPRTYPVDRRGEPDTIDASEVAPTYARDIEAGSVAERRSEARTDIANGRMHAGHISTSRPRPGDPAERRLRRGVPSAWVQTSPPDATSADERLSLSLPVFFRGILTRSRWTAHSAASSPWRASTG